MGVSLLMVSSLHARVIQRRGRAAVDYFVSNLASQVVAISVRVVPTFRYRAFDYL